MPKIPNPYYREELQEALENLKAKPGFQELKKGVAKFIKEEWLKAFPLSKDFPSEQRVLQAAARHCETTAEKLSANFCCDSTVENFFQETILKLIENIKEKFKLTDVEAWTMYNYAPLLDTNKDLAI